VSAVPVLYLIACGARPAGEVAGFVRSAQADGWDVCVIATPDGAKFLDAGHLAELTGHPVRTHYKQPDEPDVLPPPDAMVVAPATFNSLSKLAAGITDTLALGLVSEAIGLGLPVIAAAWAGAALASHPAFERSIAALRAWGITVIHDPGRSQAGAGGPAFPWDELRARLAGLRAAGQS
jgi:phosphopantothenoylcysteine synthetase/decarboxylase